jgi:hypothetical protein
MVSRAHGQTLHRTFLAEIQEMEKRQGAPGGMRIAARQNFWKMARGRSLANKNCANPEALATDAAFIPQDRAR